MSLSVEGAIIYSNKTYINYASQVNAYYWIINLERKCAVFIKHYWEVKIC